MSKKEVEYQRYIIENIGLVEEGIRLIAEEFQVGSSRIDILCGDKNGKDVGLELKYPAASNEVIGQILRFKEDYKRKTGNQDVRFILITPQISDELKNLLMSNNLEYKEILF